jgi:putative membrane protein
VSASEPEVAGRLHPLAVLLVARRFVGASVIPLLALFISLGTRVLAPLALGAVVVGVLAVLWWWRFTYRVAGGRLEVRSGIVNRTTRIVPLDRIRGVDLTASFAHRLLGLVKVEIEAAAGGGDQAELSLAAVSRAEGEALRALLLGGARAAETAGEPPALYRATPRLLALGGLTSGRYLLAPAAVVGVLFNLADNLPGGLVERATDAAVEKAPTDPVGIAAAAGAGVLLVLLLAVTGSLLVDWGFTLSAEGDRLTAERGLLTRRTVSIDRERIRGLDVRDTPLRRPFGAAAVTAVAGGVGGAGGRTTLAPVVRADDVFPLLRSVDPLAPDPRLPLAAHPTPARRRRFVRALPLPALGAAVALALGWWWAAAAGLALTVAAVPLAVDRYRQLGHRFDGRRLAVREGSLLRRWTELDPAGIVSFELRRSPTQRSAGLATVVLHLGEGAGSRRALDAGAEQARTLLAQLHPRLFEPLLERSYPSGFSERAYVTAPASTSAHPAPSAGADGATPDSARS